LTYDFIIITIRISRVNGQNTSPLTCGHFAA
jgi:hypothetical protein